MVTINFSELGMPVFTGRARGLSDRARLKLDDIDKKDETVRVLIPSDVYTVTSSYFLGLFGESIRALGRDDFIRRYSFDSPSHIAHKIDDWISRALRSKKNLFGLED